MPTDETVFVDPDHREFMAQARAFRASPDLTAAVTAMRAAVGSGPGQDAAPRPGLRREATALGSGSSTVSAVVLRPDDDEPVPYVVVLHSGGFISGSADTGLQEFEYLLADGRVALVSLDYPLAPETSFEQTSRWCADVLRTLVTRAGAWALVGPPVLAGSSAGGALAVDVALHAPEVALAGLMLHAPMLDARSDTASQVATAGTGVWDQGWNRVGWEAAGVTSGWPFDLGRVSFADLPPLYLDVGSADPMLDETLAFARAAWRLGRDATMHVWPGAPHGFDFALPQTALAQQAHRTRSDWVRRILSADPLPGRTAL